MKAKIMFFNVDNDAIEGSPNKIKKLNFKEMAF